MVLRIGRRPWTSGSHGLPYCSPLLFNASPSGQVRPLLNAIFSIADAAKHHILPQPSEDHHPSGNPDRRGWQLNGFPVLAGRLEPFPIASGASAPVAMNQGVATCQPVVGPLRSERQPPDLWQRAGLSQLTGRVTPGFRQLGNHAMYEPGIGNERVPGSLIAVAVSPARANQQGLPVPMAMVGITADGHRGRSSSSLSGGTSPKRPG